MDLLQKKGKLRVPIPSLFQEGEMHFGYEKMCRALPAGTDFDAVRNWRCAMFLRTPTSDPYDKIRELIT